MAKVALSKAEEDKILSLAIQKLGVAHVLPTLEAMLTSTHGFGLSTATDLQRAVCRVIDGAALGDLDTASSVVRALNGKAPEPARPAEVILISGVRTAKSLIAAAVALRATQQCDLSLLSSGEIPRYSILSLSLDNAKVVMSHLVGALQKPVLQHLRVPDAQASKWRELMDESGAESAWSVFVWHPSGRPIEIRVIAGKRAGGSLVSRWSVGCCLDEAPRMIGEGDGVINYDDARRAVRTRLLPGAQLVSIGSPWQPWGPIYDRVQNYWGRPSKDLVVIKAPGPDMNPFWWTPERCEEIKRSDPTAYQTDVLAEFADLEEAMFPVALLEKATRTQPGIIPWEPGHSYRAAIDPATRGNAWTLVIADKKGAKKRIVYNQEWIGSSLDPLSPRRVLYEIREVLAEYGLDWCYTDQWSSDALKDLAYGLGFALVIEEWNEKNKTEAFLNLAAAMADGQIEIPNDPVLLKDLRLTKKYPKQHGVSIRLVNTPDGRHCDYAPPIARCLNGWIEQDRETKGAVNVDEAALLQEAELADKVDGGDKDWFERSPYHGDGI